jgi:hypothetical protein
MVATAVYSLIDIGLPQLLAAWPSDGSIEMEPAQSPPKGWTFSSNKCGERKRSDKESTGTLVFCIGCHTNLGLEAVAFVGPST